MAVFESKPWANTFGKMSIFRLFGFLVFKTLKGVFPFQNIVKDIFVAYIALKKIGKIASFGFKPWANPFGKMSIFFYFWNLLFL